MLVGHLVCAYWVSDSNTASPQKNGPTLLEMLERAFSSLVEPVLTWLTLQTSAQLRRGGGAGEGGHHPPHLSPKNQTSKKDNNQHFTNVDCPSLRRWLHIGLQNLVVGYPGFGPRASRWWVAAPPPPQAFGPKMNTKQVKNDYLRRWFHTTSDAQTCIFKPF